MSSHLNDFVPSTVGPLRGERLTEDALRAARVDAILVCLPTPLAGMGTHRQLQGIAAGLDELAKQHPHVQIGYVGPALKDEAPLLSRPFSAVAPADSVADRYKAATRAFEAAFAALVQKDRRRIAVVCMGYTAYGPESVKRALRDHGNRRPGDSPDRVSVLVVDSAYPDTDQAERGLDPDGWPTSRFYTPAFESNDTVSVSFLLTSAYDYDPALLNSRAPSGLAGVSVVAPPYTDAYLNELAADGGLGKRRGLGGVAQALPGATHVTPDDRIVPIVSSDVWSEDAVGAWMTEDEHRTCTQGLETIARALVLAAERIERRIFCPVDTAGAAYLAGCGIAGLGFAEAGREADVDRPVVMSPYRGLPQRSHTRLLGAADVAISRTGGQANAAVVLALAKTPNVVIDMPACGYMQSELTSLFVTHTAAVTSDGAVRMQSRPDPLGWRSRWHAETEALADVLIAALQDTREGAKRAEQSHRAFQTLRHHPLGNVSAILQLMIAEK